MPSQGIADDLCETALFRGRFLGLDRLVDEHEDRQLGLVAEARVSGPQDPGVAAGTVPDRGRDGFEQAAYRRFVGHDLGRASYGVQVGGAAGHCIPASQFDRAIAFEDLATGGSIMVFGPERDMLEVAQNFMEFFEEESCGQCTPCREGNARLLEGIELLEEGQCSMKYLRELCQLGESMQMACKCGLGQTSPNAFLSIIEHFKDEIMGRVSAAC